MWYSYNLRAEHGLCRFANGTLEKAMKHLYPSELNCNAITKTQTLNPVAAEFQPRTQRRDVAGVARMRPERIADTE